MMGLKRYLGKNSFQNMHLIEFSNANFTAVTFSGSSVDTNRASMEHL